MFRQHSHTARPAPAAASRPSQSGRSLRGRGWEEEGQLREKKSILARLLLLDAWHIIMARQRLSGLVTSAEALLTILLCLIKRHTSNAPTRAGTSASELSSDIFS